MPAANPLPSRPAEPLTYTTAELTAALGCSLRHVRRLQAAGHLPPPVRLGRLVRWPRAAIDRWLAAGGTARRR